MPQTPTRRLHALLASMTCGENIEEENIRECGSKHCWQDETAKIPDDKKTRLQAKYNCKPKPKIERWNAKQLAAGELTLQAKIMKLD